MEAIVRVKISVEEENHAMKNEIDAALINLNYLILCTAVVVLDRLSRCTLCQSTSTALLQTHTTRSCLV